MINLHEGYILFVNVRAGVCDVRCPALNTVVSNVALQSGSGVLPGAENIDSPGSGTPVLIALNDETSAAYVVSIIPKHALDIGFLPQNGHPAGGSIETECAALCAKPGTPGQEPNNRPADAFPGIAFGHESPLGIGVGGGLHDAWVKAGDFCGVFAMFYDQCLRDVSWNRESWTSAGWSDRKVVGNAINEVDYFTPYRYEAQGYNSPGEGVPKDIDIPQDLSQRMDAGDPVALDTYRKMLIEYARQSIHPEVLPRLLSYRGLLGNLLRMFVARPGSTVYGDMDAATGLASADALDMDVPSGDTPLLSGLFEAALRGNGALRVKSAKKISVEKALDIRVPYRQRPPETNPDVAVQVPPENMGQAPEEQVQYDPGKKPETREWLGSPTQLAAFAQELEESDVAFADGLFAATPGYVVSDRPPLMVATENFEPERVLESKFQFTAPAPTVLRVDQDTQERYYGSKAGIYYLPDGGLVLRDGFGSEIIMAGGNIYLTAPGDIWERCGRDSVKWAGRHAIVRAQNDVEVVSDAGSVRIKAQDTFHAVGGNAGDHGGVVLENKATSAGDGVGGIAFISPTFVTNETPSVLAQQRISSPIVNAQTVNAKDTLTQNADIETLTAAGGKFGGVANNALIAAHALGTPQRHAVTPAPTLPLIPASPPSDGSYFSTVSGGKIDDLRGSNPPKAFFAFLSGADYGIPSDFIVQESAWQRYYRAAGIAKTWAPIEVDGTLPFPGREIWESDAYCVADLTQVDGENTVVDERKQRLELRGNYVT